LRISEIFEQYIEYIAKMQEMDLDIASEFVQMASHLVYLKTRTLLAGDEEVSELEELISSLEQLKCHDAYVNIKAVIPEFSAKAEQGFLLYSKTPEPLSSISGKTYRYSHEPEELLSALLSVFSRTDFSRDAEQAGIMVPKRIIYGVREKCAQLINLFKIGGAYTLNELYSMSRSRSEVIATFISVLELCSMGTLEIAEEGGELIVSLRGDAPDSLPDTIPE
ncbi:MAG: segregation/condensation protein A, partial [Clostridiales bacterium]|nr:segregation/condensation protein A [Clostridiales bacterium]